jgi:UDP-N-acetylmuramyl pentapeptide phosphotransferase/UDP-N-acetylglucosamine-1-phosphate transferase
MEILISATSGFVLSVLLTGLALVYAHRRGLLDQPGRRRSHDLPTPRGGGLGVVVASLAVGVPDLLGVASSWPPREVAAVALSVLAVACVGWRDDHAPLAIGPRIAVHLAAALLVAAVALLPAAARDPWLWVWLVPVAIVLAGCINAYNFMDGIDGILGQQALFVMLGYALLAGSAGEMALASAAFAVAAACLGFLLFNAPPARIFMGDVGSGALGMLIGAFATLLVQRHLAMLWPCAILSSAFLTDSALTLARRMLGRHRWYTAHREHLYQWLVRTRWSHARTDVAYMIWNLGIAAPAAWCAMQWPSAGVAWCVAVYAVGGLTWLFGKRACLASANRRIDREVA